MEKKDYRTLFLKEFTKSLILNSKPKRDLFPNHPVKPNLSQLVNLPENQLIEDMTSSIKQTTEISVQMPQQTMPQMKTPLPRSQPNPMTVNLPQRNRLQPTQQQMPLQNIQIKSMMPRFSQNPEIASISPNPQPPPQGFSLIKIDSLIRDNQITAIECAGPGKPLIVRSLGRVSPTRISLSEEEIKKIIETYSLYSRIPMMEGVFKAAVGNTLITAVISDFVGSRFIINKFTPYSLIEKQM